MSELSSLKHVQPLFPEHVSVIFERLDESDVEHFYTSYHLWSLQRRIEILQVETELLQKAVADNDELLQQARPSAIALASLAQFQASGVNDIDLLDSMLARGEDWLDHTIQLLRHCEDLDVIGSNYTQWCEHALEGAYDWIESMTGLENEAAAVDTLPGADTATEEQLLQKLMSEDEQTEKLPVADLRHEEALPIDVATTEEVAPASVLTAEPEIGESGEPASIGDASEPAHIVSGSTAAGEELDVSAPTGDAVALLAVSSDSDTAAGEESAPVDESIAVPIEIPEMSPDITIGEIEETAPTEESVLEEIVAVEDEPVDTTDIEAANSPTIKRPALTSAQITEVSATEQTEQAEEEEVPPTQSPTQSNIASTTVSAREERMQVRQGGFWHFLRRLHARFWHE